MSAAAQMKRLDSAIAYSAVYLANWAGSIWFVHHERYGAAAKWFGLCFAVCLAIAFLDEFFPPREGADDSNHERWP